MKHKNLFMLIMLICISANMSFSQNREEWQPISMKVNDVTGVYQWSINWDISFTYKKFDKLLPDGSGLFINRQIDQNSYLPTKPLITRDSRGINEISNGANVSMAALPTSKLYPDSGGEIYDESDGRTAHQRDWDALVEIREKIFDENNVTNETPLLEKIKTIANWAQKQSRKGPLYVSKHPVDVLYHGTFCVGRSNVFVAIMHTMGLHARTINMNTHSIAEVLVDSKWYYVENSRGNDNDTMATATLMPSSFFEFYADLDMYSKYTSGYHKTLYRDKDLHNGRANWELGAWWNWHFLQCGNGDDNMMKHTLETGSGIAVSLNGATSKALYPNEKKFYYKVLNGNPPVLTNYQKNSWYIAGYRVLQGDGIRKQFFIGNLDDEDNPVTKVTSCLYLMGGETQTFAIPPVIGNDYAEWTLKVNDKVYKLKDWDGWKLVKELDPLTLLPVIYFEFQLDKDALKQNDYNIFQFGSKAGEKFKEQHIYIMIFPDPILPYVNPFKPGDNAREQKNWRMITDQKWDLLELFEFAR